MRILPFVVFLAGTASMSLQLIGSRLLAPHFGNSIFVWTSLIGVMLGFMALGNIIGGRLADRKTSPDLLFWILLLVSVSVSLVAMIGVWSLGSFTAIGSVRTGMVLASVALFAIPCVLFGMVVPASIRLRMQTVSDSGANVGGLSAVSMIGNIAGTFATGFWLIALVGSRSLLAWLALLVLILAMMMGLSFSKASRMHAGEWWQGGRSPGMTSKKLLAILAAAVLVAGAFLWQPTHASLAEFRVFDSLYDQYFVGEVLMPSRTDETGAGPASAGFQTFALQEQQMRPVRFLANSPHAMESAVYLDSTPPLKPYFFEYYAYYNLAAAIAPRFSQQASSAAPDPLANNPANQTNTDPGRALMIGGGAFVYPRFFFDQYPSAYMDVVEIDPMLVAEAKENFGFEQPPNMNIYLEDGRMFLNRAVRTAASTAANAATVAIDDTAATANDLLYDTLYDTLYDLIILDAFNSANTVPFQLTTLQSMQHVSDLLVDDGIFVMNLIASVEGQGSAFLASQYATLNAVFPQVEVYLVREGEILAGTPRNIALVASKNPRANLHAALTRADNSGLYLTSRRLDSQFLRNIPGSMVLTDDFAPVDQMLIGVNR